MKTISQHIEHVQGQPHHIRKRIAFGTATVVTTVIALVWLTSNLALGGFAIKSSTFAESTGQEGSAIAVTRSADSSNLAGAASAVPSASAPAQIEIVDTSSSSPEKQPEQTTIPF